MGRGISKNSKRWAVLAAFRADPGATVREIAERAGTSVTNTHFHITSLEADGLIHANHQTGNRRGRYTHRMSAEEISRIRREAAKKGRKGKQAKGELERRIDMVVEKARAVDSGQSTVRGGRSAVGGGRWAVDSGRSMKCHKVG